jgi:integrase
MAQIKRRTTAKDEVRYDVRARVGGRVVTRTFKRKRDADAYATTIEADRLRGVAIDPRAGRVRFRTYADGWLARRPELAATTREDYRHLLDTHLLPAFGSSEIATITPSAVRSWWALLATEYPSRAAKGYRLLRTILATAVRDELLARNPCQVAGAGQEHAAERPTATVAEVEALAAAMPDRWSDLVRLAAWCGLRRGELLGLCRQDIDLLHGLVHVQRSMISLADGTIITKAPKTAAGRRRVAVPPHLLPFLKAHLGTYVQSSSEALVFTGEKGGPLGPRVLQMAWDKARKEVGRTDLHLHDLRHSGNTWAAATGASTAELMARMGHASPVAALRYQHATEERDRVIAEALSKLARPASITPITAVARDGRAMGPRHDPARPKIKPPRHGVSPAASSEQPQRDSNPCLHLERVMS